MTVTSFKLCKKAFSPRVVEGVEVHLELVADVEEVDAEGLQEVGEVGRVGLSEEQHLEKKNFMLIDLDQDLNPR